MRFLFLITLISANAWAEPLTLNEAIHEALTDSPQLKKMQSARNETAWKRVETYSGFLPSVNAGASYLTSKKYLLTDVVMPGTAAPISFPAIVPTTNLVLNAQLPIFDGFASTNRFRSARAFERSAQDELDAYRFQLSRQVILQYYRALAAQTLQNVAKQNIKTLEDHLKEVELFKKAGVSTNYDVLRVEVQVSEANAELLNAGDNAILSRTKLAELLGHESESRSIEGDLPILSAEMIKNAKLDLENRVDLTGLAEKSEALDHLESAAAAYWVPKINLFGQYQYYNNINDKISDNGAFRDAYQVGFNLSWNIFDGAASIARSKQSAEQRFQAEKTLHIAQLNAKQELEVWKRKYLYYCSIYRSRVNEVEKSQESVRLARVGRRVGARTNTELLDAETELFRARAGAITAQVGAIEALLNLELASGQEIHRFF